MTDHLSPAEEGSTDGVASRLARLAGQPVDVSAARLDAIEARVRASREAHESDEHRPALVLPVSDQASSGTRRASRLALVAASILAVMLASIALLDNGDDTLVVAVADGVAVILPDGGSLVAVDGTELPDDSIVDVSGFLEVGGRRYGPGRYRVDSGRLVPIVDDSPQVVSSDTPEGTVDADPDATVTEPRPLPTSPDTPERPRVTSTRSTAPPPTRPPNTRPPPTRPPTTPPARTTVPDETVPQRAPATLPAPTTTTGPPPTRPAAADPAAPDTPTTVARSTTTTTTTIVRRRPQTR